MKKVILLLSMLSILACKKNKEKESEPGIMDAVESVQNLGNAADALKDSEKRLEELKKLQPVSNEVLKSVLTEELGELKRTNFSAGSTSMMGISSAEATYGESSDKNIQISILDGAGESGSGIMTLTLMALAMDVESIDNTTTKKSEVINGNKCLTENDTNPDSIDSSITFIHKERYQITITGNKVPLDELKTYMKKIDLSKLD